MRWEELTGDQFAEAVKACDGVCLVALSVVERHGHHLPLGTDTYQGRGMLSRVAALEPVIEFPDYIFTQIPEARHLPGTISIDGDLMIKLLDNVCREIARNGCKKVVLLNAHGGNFGLVALFNMLQLYTPKDYVVYIVSPFGAMRASWSCPGRAEDGHAGPGETGMMLATAPRLVNMSKVPADDEGRARGPVAGPARGRRPDRHLVVRRPPDALRRQRGARYGRGRRADPRRDRASIAAVRAIKADTAAKQLQDEFFAASQAPS